MKRNFFIAVLLLISIASSTAAGQKTAELTIYTEGLALVKEIRELKLEQGENMVEFSDIPSQIDHTSVYFRLLTGPDAVAVLEQQYKYDLVNSAKVLEKYLGRQIQVFGKEGWMCEGKLLSSSTRDMLLETKEGEIRIIRLEQISGIHLSHLPEGLITKPTLIWLIDCKKPGVHKAELAYLTGGINWHAEYIAVANKDNTQLELEGWVSIDNRSGASYQDAKLKLIAGKIHRAYEEIRPPKAFAVMAKRAEEQFEERPFFEYHLYTLGRTATVENNQAKQLSLFPNARVDVDRIYSYDATKDEKHIKVGLEFKNAQKEGLGMPLPAGKVRIYKRDAHGSLELIGEDRIDHTPEGEKVKLVAGNAFDIAGERKVTEHQRISDRVTQETVQIKLRNHKKETVNVLVTEHLPGDWEIRKSSLEYRKKDAHTIEFDVPVEKDGEAVVEYTVIYRR